MTLVSDAAAKTVTGFAGASAAMAAPQREGGHQQEAAVS